MSGAFVFRNERPPRLASARLEDVVRGRSCELDARALAARMLLLPPFRRGETPYLSVTAHREPTPVPELDEAPPASPEDAIVRVRDALRLAVTRALTGVRRAAVLTGGGLDSSVLLALAVAHARETGGTAFGVALDFESSGDDRPHLRAVEQRLGCEIIRVRPEECTQRWPLVLRGVDATPLTWPGGAMEIELLSRARAHGAELALTGAGADELFDGEPRALAELVRGRRLRAAVDSARKLRGFDAPRSRLLTWLARPMLAGLLPVSLRAWRARRGGRRIPSWVTPRVRAWVDEQRDAQLREALVRPHGARARREAQLSRPHLDHLAWLRHQEEVGSGLGRVDPYLDTELVAAISCIPEPMLLHGDVRRGLFREATRELLPDSLRARLDKASFEPAFARFVAAADGFERLRPLASVPRLAALGLVDAARFREAFEAFVVSAADETGAGWTDVWPALCVEAFLASGEVKANEAHRTAS